MQISVSNDKSLFTPKDVLSMQHLAKLVTNNLNWSSGVFSNNKRNNENFERADTIALDYDDTLSLDEALTIFAPYKHVIYTSSNHQKAKVVNKKTGATKPACDRFRVILKLTTPITDIATYYSTWHSLEATFPHLDPQCKDPARLWYPGELVSFSDQGLTIDTVAQKIQEPTTVTPAIGELTGMLSNRTYKFLLFGAPDGQWNRELTKASIDLMEQGYSFSDAKTLLKRPTGHLDSNDIRTIESIFSGERQYAPRGISGEIQFKKVSDLGKGAEALEWLVDGLLTRGGMSVISGRPKSGKSTLARQMSISVSRGEQFLNRDTKKGQVLYIALEEQESMLSAQFAALGRTEDDDILVHVGGLSGSQEVFNQLRNIVVENKPALLIIDTLALMANFENQNNYTEVNGVLSKYRTLARESGTHVLFVHHSNKLNRRDVYSISGSAAIPGAMDTNIVFSSIGQHRVINSSQRGGVPFINRELIFDPRCGSYSLGGIYDDNF